MFSKDHNITLELVLQASKKLEEFIKGFDLERFLEDSKTQSSVIMQLIVIGELVKKLPERIKDKIDLPWKLMAGFRDLAVHEYFELDLNKIWDTATNDIPMVIKKLQDYLNKA
jgi:uncharacterized protein with HEPN domain